MFAQYGLLVVPAAGVFLLTTREIKSTREGPQSDGQLARKARLGLSARLSKFVAPLSALLALDSFQVCLSQVSVSLSGASLHVTRIFSDPNDPAFRGWPIKCLSC